MMKRALRLGVNIDHVATIRNARGGPDPDPVRAAKLAANAGADGITAHLREDRRHITDTDITRPQRGLGHPDRKMMHSQNLLRAAWAPALSHGKRPPLSQQGELIAAVIDIDTDTLALQSPLPQVASW